MAMTMTQKILASHAGLESVTAGQLIEANLDLTLANDITGPVAIREMEKAGFEHVFDKNKIALVMDHFAPNKDIKSAEQCLTSLLIDLNELLSCKLAFIRYQARPDCKVSFGTYIIPFVIMAMVQTGVIEIPVPCHKLGALYGQPAGKHCAVKLSERLIRFR